MNWLNLGIIIILIYAAKVGFEQGLVMGIWNLFIVFWATLVAFTFFGPLSDIIQKFLIHNQWLARVISFGLLFIVAAILLWKALGERLQKEKIILLQHLHRLGGLICGLLFGLGLSSFLAVTIYMVPLKGRDKETFSFLENPVIFYVDELLPRFYGLVAREKLSEEKEGEEEEIIYSFEEFMYKHNYIRGKKYKPKKEKKIF